MPEEDSGQLLAEDLDTIYGFNDEPKEDECSGSHSQSESSKDSSSG